MGVHLSRLNSKKRRMRRRRLYYRVRDIDSHVPLLTDSNNVTIKTIILDSSNVY